MQQFPQFRSATYHSTDGKSLAYHRTVIITLTIIGFIFWGTSISIPAGLCFSAVSSTIHFNGFLLVVVNSAYIICAFQTVSLITSDNFPTADGLERLRTLISLSSAAALVGLSVFVSSTIYFGVYGAWDEQGREQLYYYSGGGPTAFGCSFSVFWSILVVIWVTVYYRKCCIVLAKATNFSSDPGAFEVRSPPPTAYHNPMATNEASQLQILTEIQQQHQLQQQQQQQQQQEQQQQQNVVMITNNSQQRVLYTHRPPESDTATSAPSYVYIPPNNQSLG
ncbi:uncharacterized protein [Macrobrachium rosenbergii]|uniref:uncharacterized protein n=1 Tax=Macrobrachium rosenbergii TaxID=79674 RepID=UPI0034D5BA72